MKQESKKAVKSLHHGIIKKLAESLRQNVELLFQTNLSVEEIYNAIVRSPDLNLGHFAFPCFPLAKALKLGPPVIASKLAAAKYPSIVESCSAAGPYLNFKISSATYGEEVVLPILSENFFHPNFLQVAPTVMVEYSQPNTHKELHVGHMRNLCLGDALVRLLRYSGHQVFATTYPGDVGTHVAKCLWYYKKFNPAYDGKKIKGAWIGELYSKANNLLEDQLGTPDEEKNRAELTAILKQLEGKSGPYYDLWLETKPWSVELMQQVYAWAGVKFDRWYWESECDSPSLKLAQDYFSKGLLIKSEGAIGMDLNEDGLGFCMIIKSDGTGLYATKDVLLGQKKFQDYPIDRSIYVVDKRQAHHFKQVFKVLEKIGFEHAQDCYHLQYDFVELPDGAMSSRKGNIVPLQALIEQMENKIKTDYLEKYRGDWSDQEIATTARQIAGGAIKYGMIRMDNSRKIVFEMSEWLKLDGETGPYLQYVYARINSLLNKIQMADLGSAQFSKLILPQEVSLLAHLAQFNSTVVEAALQFKTPLVCSYLYDLGKLFNNFYAECPIGKLEDQELKKARLALSSAVAKVMKQGLAVLGIESPERM